MPKHLCLNAIVRNENARILRMLDSVKDYISCFVILDTGSTDGTPDTIQAWASDKGIPGVVAHGAFVDFSQARNDALAAARSYHSRPDAPWFDYILLVDADMELVVDTKLDAFGEHLSGAAYLMTQTAGAVSYKNTRLLSAASSAKYIGATHEYLDAAPAGTIGGAWFRDHADGSNRVDKFERDIRLLVDDLATDPNNPRSWFYLANSYRDKGDLAAAANAYRKRVALGGWEEEVWTAQVNLANVLEQQGLDDASLKETLKAYQMRPTRAEPLHALAKHYRLKGENAVAMLFVEAGIAILKPDDLLFVEDWVYDWGFREEFSIAGFYQERTRDRAGEVINGLAIDPTVPGHVREQARTNTVHYLRPLRDFCPSYKDQEISFTPSPGFVAMNPSVTTRPTGGIEVLLRTVNYKIDEHGRYMIGEKGCWDAPIETENWLLQINERTLRTTDFVPVRWERPAPQFDKVIGLEDMRIFWHKGQRQFVACAREQSATGTPEQWHGYLPMAEDCDSAVVRDAKLISDPACCEKNWSPICIGPELHFMYRADQMQKKSERVKLPCRAAVDNISGGSPYIPFRNGFLSIVHEAVIHPSHGRRIYQHRFVWLEPGASRVRLSMPFVFRGVQIEFAAGIAENWTGPAGTFVISFGERDAKAVLCSVAMDEVAGMLRLNR